MHRPLWLFRLATALLGTVLVAGLTACGSADSSESSDAAKLAEPVSVTHKFGTTKIDTVPRRIVTIDLQWTDVLLAMGVEPVGHTVDSLMPDSKVPWQKLPSGAKALPLTDGVPVEQVLALNPDLVLGSFSISDEETYKLLSDRVPTIAGPPDTEVLAWQDMVRTAGKFLNEQGMAKEIVKSVDDKVAGVMTEPTVTQPVPERSVIVSVGSTPRRPATPGRTRGSARRARTSRTVPRPGRARRTRRRPRPPRTPVARPAMPPRSSRPSRSS